MTDVALLLPGDRTANPARAVPLANGGRFTR
jgi:hypothetical protein